MLRQILCALGWHVRSPDYVGSKKVRGRKRYAYYCTACSKTFTRRRKP